MTDHKMVYLLKTLLKNEIGYYSKMQLGYNLLISSILN
jgi:hypothetical protein